MSDKFRNKYRTDSTRLRNWNYGWDAAYFITICTKDREFYFGDFKNGKMILNDIGEIVQSEWLKTFEMRPDMNLTMGEYVIMPNHIHAIIGIGENDYNIKKDGGNNPDLGGTGAMHCASTAASGPTASGPKASGSSSGRSSNSSQNQFGPQSKNLAAIIRGFKSGVTIRARSIVPDFAWQTRFHDHIIRNPKSFERISNYIKNNPLNWKGDKFHE